MRILIVDNDNLTTQAIVMHLAAAGIDNTVVATGEAAFEAAEALQYDAIMMEIDLADGHGIQVLRRIRSARINSPVILMSRIADKATLVSGLDFGADDFLVKPIDRDEMVARLHAIIRRSRGIVNSIVTCGPLSLDMATQTISVSGKRLRVTRKEYAILEMLFLRRGIPITKEMFIDHLYAGVKAPAPKIIDVFMCKIRKRIEDIEPDGARCLETVWGRGYAIREPQGEASSTKTKMVA